MWSALPLAIELLLACPPTAPADMPELPAGRRAFQSYGAEHGLQNSAELNIVQDGAGYLWSGSQDGVFRYDGDRFERFGTEEGLPSSYVSALAVGRDGRVWAGTWRGIAVFDGARFHRVAASAGVPEETINALAFDRDGRLLVATKSGAFEETDAGHYAPIGGSTSGEATALWVEADGSVIIAHGAFLERRSTGGAWSRFGADEGLHDDGIVSVMRDGEGRLWAHSRDRLWRASAASGDALRFDDLSCLLPSRNSEGTLARGPDGELLVPTAKGILWIGHDRAVVLDQRHGLPTDEAMAAFVDREGSLWVASVGLHRMLGRGAWWSYTSNEGLPNNVIWSITRGRDGVLWIGTDDGLARATPRGFEVIAGTEGHSFRALGFARDGALWGGGSPGELLRVDLPSKAIARYGNAAGIYGSEILGFTHGSDGRLWVGTARGGLFKSDLAPSPKFTRVPLSGGDGTEDIMWVMRDSHDRIWATGDRGLAMIEADGTTARRFTTADGLRSAHGTWMLERRDGEMCLAYFESLGVSCFRVTARGLENVHHLDRTTGLPSDKVYSIGEDDLDRLWLGTAVGVAVVDSTRVEVFHRTDGTPGDDFDAMAFYGDHDAAGTIWLGTSTGLGRYAGHARALPPTPRAVLSSVRLGRRTLDAPYPQDVKVPYADGSLAVRFSGLSFVNETRVAYEIRLVGIDDAFRPAAGREADYPALAPGSYRFEVRARYGDALPGDVASLAFVVLPAWWQTVWARGLAVVSLLLLTYAGVRYRLASLRVRNLELEQLVHARTEELGRAQAKVAESSKLSALGRVLAQLSHEINNPVNVITNNLEPMRAYLRDMVKALVALRALAASSPAAAAEAEALWSDLELDFVTDDFEKALKVVDLSATRVRDVQSALRSFMRSGPSTEQGPKAEDGDIVEALKETVEMLRRGLPKGVTIDERYDAVPGFAFQRGQLNQVFLNLLKNALEAVGDHGVVEVTARLVEDSAGEAVEIAIADSGPGIAASVRERIFEPFFTTKDVGKGTGLGLAICRQIVVENHGGTLEVEPVSPQGARFVARFPIARPGEERHPVSSPFA